MREKTLNCDLFWAGANKSNIKDGLIIAGFNYLIQSSLLALYFLGGRLFESRHTYPHKDAGIRHWTLICKSYIDFYPKLALL